MSQQSVSIKPKTNAEWSRIREAENFNKTGGRQGYARHVYDDSISLRESSATTRMVGQTHGSAAMNDLGKINPPAPIAAFDEERGMWCCIGPGEDGPEYAEYDDEEEAENALERWAAQAKSKQPMSGKEGNYSKQLLPNPPKLGNPSASNVMHGKGYSESNNRKAQEDMNHRMSEAEEWRDAFEAEVQEYINEHGGEFDEEDELAEGAKMNAVRAFGSRAVGAVKSGASKFGSTLKSGAARAKSAAATGATKAKAAGSAAYEKAKSAGVGAKDFAVRNKGKIGAGAALAGAAGGGYALGRRKESWRDPYIDELLAEGMGQKVLNFVSKEVPVISKGGAMKTARKLKGGAKAALAAGGVGGAALIANKMKKQESGATGTLAILGSRYGMSRVMEALVDYRDENGEDPTPEELIAQIEGLEDEDEE